MGYKHAFVGGILALGGVFSVSNVFAESYQREVEVQFNVRSSLEVNITGEGDHADIEILDLAPGLAKDSNIINVGITTNNILGYTATATVGSTTYADTNMTNTTDSTKVFTSLATNASEASLSTENTWGYSTSDDGGSTWGNFSGLPLYTDSTGKTISESSDPTNDSFKFKINAYASTTQPAGDYRNVINFIVVANTPPRDFADVVEDDPTIPIDEVTHKPTLQGMSDRICGAVEKVDSQYQFTDSRDHKTYWVAKLKDGKCWMTQNLDLDLDSTKTYTNENTDIGYNGITYTTASWTPDYSTVPAEDLDSSTGGISDWNGSGIVPQSVDPGEWYYTDTWATSSGLSNYGQWGSSTILSTTPYTDNGTHGHIGNYYNWPAAIAKNNIGSQEYISYTYENYNPTVSPKTSICPSGWRLPVISIYSQGVDGDHDYYNLLRHYKNSFDSDSDVVGAAPLWFTRTGYTQGTTGNNAGYAGYYWSSTMDGSGYARVLDYSSYGISLQNSWSRSFALPVRCVSRDQDLLTITFNANGGTGPTSTQRIAYGSRTPLMSNSFTRSGYVFNGWNTDPDGKGDGYADGGSYRTPINTLANTHVTLYAQWVPENSYTGVVPGGVTIGQAYEFAYTEHGKSAYQGHFAMQDIDLTYNNVKVCDLVTVIGDKYDAIDTRDGTIYEITKAPDGRCWMNKNLSLDLLDSNVQSAMDSTNTNASDEALGYLFSGGGTTSDQYATTAVSNWTSGKSYSAPLINALSKDTTKTSLQHSYDLFIPANDWKFGVYYNYCAATAGSYCYGDGDNDGGTPVDRPGTTIDAEYDICPAGWRLPSGLSNGEHVALYNSYSGASDTGYALLSDYLEMSSQMIAFRRGVKMAVAGWVENGSVSSQGTTSGFWTSSNGNDAEHVDTLYVYTTGSYNSYYLRTYGLSVRCINKQ